MNATQSGTARGGDTSQVASPAATDAGSDDFAITSAPTTQEPQSDAAETSTTDGDGGEARVPSARLREEASRRREVEQQLTQTQSQLQQMQNQLIMQQQLANMQNQQQAAQRVNPDDEYVRMFGDPEEGAGEAYNAVKAVAEHVAGQAVQQAAQNLQREMDKRLGGVTASLATSERLAAMKERGLIDDNAEKSIGQRMSQTIQQDARWGEPGNQPHLLNQIYMNMLESGEIKPGRRSPNPSNAGGMGSTMWQPGGHGQPDAAAQQAALDNQLREIQQRFPRRFGNKTIEEMRDMSASMGFGPSPSQAAPAPQQQHTEGMPGAPRTFVHTR